MTHHLPFFFFFFFNDTATTEIYTLSLHDALPICHGLDYGKVQAHRAPWLSPRTARTRDRKSTRLNSSHGYISYAVFCLKKKKKTPHIHSHNQTNSEFSVCHAHALKTLLADADLVC